jgi:hypothetical protein
MASTYSPLKVELIGTGEQAGTWGTTTNTNLGTALEEAITGRATATFPSDANYTLPYTDSNASQVFRNLVLNVTSSGNLSATRDLIIPAIEKQYIVENNTSGSQSIRVKTAAGTGVTISSGRVATVYCNGTDTRFADDFVDINGGSIDGTPIGAASASTGVFTTATITTGNITTGNINTLTVGTQTNKATLSYTTNTARTLTIPAVGGNRTFAFLEEAQVYTVDQTIGANLTFTGNSRRITGPMTSNTISERLMFQTSTTNGVTVVGAIPNGSATESRLSLFNDTDTVNMESLDLRSTATAQIVRAGAAALGTYLPLSFWNGDAERMRITGNGEVIFVGNGIKIQGKFDNYDNNATIFQDSATNASTTINIVPNGTGGAAALHCHSNSDLTNSIVGALSIDSNEVSLFSLYTGANSFQPLNLVNGGAIYTQVNSDGTVLMPGVYGSTVGGTNRDLYIDDTGKLGYLTSTRKSKTNIESIEDVSWLMQLQPVSFNRRVQASGGLYTEQAHKDKEFGLIADDVVKVRPEVCFNDDFGNLAGIHYEQLIAPMLKEIQKLRAEVEALKAKG